MMFMMSFFPKSEEAKRIISNQKLKIKFEIDIENPDGGITENRFQLLPAPYKIKTFDESTLFAGKIHALICRSYKNNVKGRDYYDYLFYVSKGSKFNLEYLKNKLNNTNKELLEDGELNLNKVKKLLKNKFVAVNYDLAKKDVSNFIKDIEKINLRRKELFLSTLDKLECN